VAQKTLQIEALSRNAVIALSEQLGESEWMLRRRAEAWQLYLDSPFPDPYNDEPWRRTPLRKLVRQLPKLAHAAYALPASDSLESLPKAILDVLRESEKRGGLLIRRDNGIAYQELDEEYAEQGVIFMDLSQALRKHPDLVQKYLLQTVRADEGKFEALHAAFVSGGAFLYVPEGVVIERTLQVVHWVDSTNVMLFPHTVVVVEDHAQATLMEEYMSEAGKGNVFVDSAVELTLARSSVLVHLALQNWAQNVTHFNFQRSTSESNSNLNATIGQFGASLTRFQTEAEMIGKGGTALLNGVFFPRGKQHHGNYTLQHHKGTHCTSDLLYKGALREKSRSVYEGGIKVAKGAQQTDAYQANRNLMLSKKSRADSIPMLEIEAHEVRCTHGSTTSQLDPEELFYLQSRGIPEEPATKLIVEGFFVPVLDRIPLRAVRERLKAAIRDKMEL
jgi:Fe-S cluster assembly protein SufD